MAADQLGCAIEDVTVRFGNTRVTPFGLAGTGGSRAGAMTGGAITYSARDLRTQILDRAANLLEANVDDLQIADGAIHVAGVPAISVSFADVAAKAAGAAEPERPPEQGVLASHNDFDGGEGGWSMATHVCWVEVDLQTGFVTIPRYVVVEDCGELINPAIVEGQVRGGVAQGIGAVLYEKVTYDDQANFQPDPDFDGDPTHRDPPHRDTIGHRGQLSRRRRRRHDRRPSSDYQRHRRRHGAPGRDHHRAAPTANPHPGVGGDYSNSLSAITRGNEGNEGSSLPLLLPRQGA